MPVHEAASVLCQAYFIFRDPEMRDPYTRQWAKARNSNIIEVQSWLLSTSLVELSGNRPRPICWCVPTWLNLRRVTGLAAD